MTGNETCPGAFQGDASGESGANRSIRFNNLAKRVWAQMLGQSQEFCTVANESNRKQNANRPPTKGDNTMISNHSCTSRYTICKPNASRAWVARLIFLAAPALLSVGPAPAQTLSKLAERGFTVIPEPQQVQLESTDLRFGSAFSVQRDARLDPGDDALESLRDHMEERFGLAPASSGGTAVQFEIRPGSVTPGRVLDSDTAAIAEQAYSLQIGPAGVRLVANAPAGLFYAVQTLVQLLRSRDGALWLPRGQITDWPDLHLRHIYWDDAHHLDRLPELKRAIRQAAFFKINGFALKLEGHFQFRSVPAAVEPWALTPAEYQELTDYALRRHVQLIPYLDGPGHLAFLLKHPEFARFRSFQDGNYELCAANPEAVKLLSAMFQDLTDANRGGRFVYFSTDEPYYVGLADNAQCREKPLAERAGSVGRLLAQFIAQVADPLHAKGRTVIFWGEYQLVPGDIGSLPPYLVNGEVYGPAFDPLFRARGIRQMVYTSTQGEERMFPEYFSLPNARLLHPVPSPVDRLGDGFREISFQPARGRADLMGAVVAGWADTGLHPETFWLGYATITAAGWHPGTPSRQEAAAAFYHLFYGEGAVNMDRIYQLMSQQARFWSDSWEWGPSTRKPLFGNSYSIFNPRRPVRDQTLSLPPAPGPDLGFDPSWSKANARRLELAEGFLADNDELLALLHENSGRVTLNRYNLEVYVSIAHLYRQNLEMLLDTSRICRLLESARDTAREPRAAAALESLDRALDLAGHIRQQRNSVLRDATATWEKSWYPRVAAANGRKFLHDLDDVKDHPGDRTIDLRYLIQREFDLPFGAWVESIRAARNSFAAAHSLALDPVKFDWLDMGSHAVVEGTPE